MKKTIYLIALLVVGGLGIPSVKAANNSLKVNSFINGNSFVFVEGGITFSVYPDGEFDFFINDRVNNLHLNANVGNVNITFNSGYNYDPYVQYDDYGAVIQVENVPIYYDYYGRVSQIGSVNIFYNNRRVVRIGGMFIHYNPYGAFSHYTGYINVYNRYYVYRPWYRFFVRPAFDFCLVSYRPYRRYYTPVRYTYYRPYRQNFRRAYVKVGRPYRNHNKVHRRDAIYRNDKRVTRRDYRANNRINSRTNARSVNRTRLRHEKANSNAVRSQSRAYRNSSRAPKKDVTRNSRQKQREYTVNRARTQVNNNRGYSVNRTRTQAKNNKGIIKSRQKTSKAVRPHKKVRQRDYAHNKSSRSVPKVEHRKQVSRKAVSSKPYRSSSKKSTRISQSRTKKSASSNRSRSRSRNRN